jgi:hypothetical protein
MKTTRFQNSRPNCDSKRNGCSILIVFHHLFCVLSVYPRHAAINLFRISVNASTFNTSDGALIPVYRTGSNFRLFAETQI